MSEPFRILFFLLALLAPSAEAAPSSAYDPLRVDKAFAPKTLDLVVHNTQRDRDIPVRVFLPAQTAPARVVLFSHGLGGSREGNAFMGQHWASRGYAVVFLQHPGSDVSVWQDLPPAQRLAALKRAANLENYLARVKDVPLVLDQLAKWNSDSASKLSGRLDLAHVGMSGHSFGALTTQAVSGQSFRLGGQAGTDSRIKAAVMFSPSSPRMGSPDDAFNKVAIPWMLMTGTRDVAPVGDADVASRLAVFPALPPGNKYELVLYNAEHSAFTDRALPGDSQQRNPNHHRVILALSTAFWDGYLRGDAAAREWLDGSGPASVLEKQDRWQKK